MPIDLFPSFKKTLALARASRGQLVILVTKHPTSCTGTWHQVGALWLPQSYFDNKQMLADIEKVWANLGGNDPQKPSPETQAMLAKFEEAEAIGKMVWKGTQKLADALIAGGQRQPHQPRAFSDGTAYAQYLATAPLKPWRSK